MNYSTISAEVFISNNVHVNCIFTTVAFVIAIIYYNNFSTFVSNTHNIVSINTFFTCR